jgi:threonine-phosphate decarboxylase
MITGHGGNRKQLATRLGCGADEIVDMSSNLNPLGPPEFVLQAVKDQLDKICVLPEPDAQTMREGFAQFHGLPASRVIAGNGTTWFIYTLPLAMKSRQVLIVGPTYSDYKDGCAMHAIPYTHCFSSASTQFVPDVDQISDMAKIADMVFICNPNNPTGALLEKDAIIYLLKTHASTLFVVDESYLPFVKEAQSFSLVTETTMDNLIVLSSMSKIFTIPGLRTGFLTASEKNVKKVMKYYQPWSVNALAQAVVSHIFDHPEKIAPFYKKTRAYIQTEKKFFLDQLSSLKGIQPFDSSVYFILARLSGHYRSGRFCRQVGDARLLIRDCANFKGLTDEYVRFSLKDRSVNQRLIDQARKALDHE